MTVDSIDRLLWLGFAVLFAVVAGAVALPMRPLVWAFPFWAVVVLGACVATIAVSVVAVLAGWPGTAAEASSAEEVTDA